MYDTLQKKPSPPEHDLQEKMQAAAVKKPSAPIAADLGNAEISGRHKYLFPGEAILRREAGQPRPSDFLKRPAPIQLQTLGGKAKVEPSLRQQFKELQSAPDFSTAPKAPALVSHGSNSTGIPLQLKKKVEKLSGVSLDDVRVHYNSQKPAQLQALAYAQGNQVHIGPGQEAHLPHELGHVVQQKRGIVRPTARLNGVNINDDKALEEKANFPAYEIIETDPVSGNVVQRALISEFGFDNADPLDQKLQYFQRPDIGIEKWILTAYEFEKQNVLLGVGAQIAVPDLMNKLYSMREMVSNTVTVTQQQAAAVPQVGNATPLLPGLAAPAAPAKTNMNLAADERLSMVTHGVDANFLVVEMVAPRVRPDPVIQARYNVFTPNGANCFMNAADTVRYHFQTGYVFACSNDVVSHISGARPAPDPATFKPFFCFMGNSQAVKNIYGDEIETALGPSLLPPQALGQAPPAVHGHGLVYNGRALKTAIKIVADANAQRATPTPWNAIINDNGNFQYVANVILSRQFPELAKYCNLSTQNKANLPTLFMPALNEVITNAFRMYNEFVDAVNVAIPRVNQPVDAGMIF